MKKRLLFSGGHYNSAISTIDRLRELRPDYEFEWVGKKSTHKNTNSPEYIDVTSRNIPFYDINAGKIYRIKSVFLIHKLIWNLLLIPVGFIQSFFIILKTKPDLIVSFGGYIALPLVVCGRLLGVRAVTHEQTVVFGIANKILLNFVDKIFVSWPVEYFESEVTPSERHKLLFTGVPLNPLLLGAKDKFDFGNDLPSVYITGGKLGSLFINKTMLGAYESLKGKVNFIWSCGLRKGEADFNEISSKVTQNAIIKEYFFGDDLAKAMHTADMVVSRGGAHTIYELAALEKPAIIIPIPWVVRNEQYKNAQILEEMGICRILSEDGVSSNDLAQEVLSFLVKIGRGEIKAISSPVVKDGSNRISNAIIEILEKNDK